MFMFFIYLGAEIGFTGWISSYVVMLDLDTKEGATRFPALFWVFITIFRFAFAGVPGKTSSKLIILTLFKICVYLLSIILTMIGFKLFAVYWNSILLGIAYSSMYTFMYTISLEFKQSINRSQTASIMTFANLGEGVLCTIMGYLMILFSPIALFYSLAFSGLIILALTHILIKDLAKNEPESKEIELRDKLNEE